LVGLTLSPKFWIEIMKWDIHLSNNMAIIHALGYITLLCLTHIWQWSFIWSVYLWKCRNLEVLHLMHWCMTTLTTICVHLMWLNALLLIHAKTKMLSFW
jgi:hypothetical protein